MVVSPPLSSTLKGDCPVYVLFEGRGSAAGQFQELRLTPPQPCLLLSLSPLSLSVPLALIVRDPS